MGLYTSPHIISYTERFHINGRKISESELLSFFQEFQATLKSFKLTYFEISTAAAFWWFAQRQVDLAVIETGLGGRLDATNVIIPELSIITNISIDHTDLLGGDQESIAREKAGIIKRGVPVVMGNISGPAAGVVRQAAQDVGSKCYTIEDLEPRWEDGIYYLTHQEEQIRLDTELFHPVQAYNIAAAWRALDILQNRFPVSREQKIRGIAQVRAIYPYLGRFEHLLPDKKWYFDGAHNVDAVKAMKRALEAIGPVNDAVLVLSLMRDKVRKPLMDEFSDFKKKFYHSMASERAATADQIKEWLPDCEAVPEDSEARKQFLKNLDTELVIFAGSFYFYPTVRDWLKLLS